MSLKIYGIEIAVLVTESIESLSLEDIQSLEDT